VCQQIELVAPSNYLGPLVEELNCALAPSERALLEIVGPVELLGCLSVLRRERVAGRVCVGNNESDRVSDLIKSMGLECWRSASDLLPLPDLIGGRIVTHNAMRVPQRTDQRAKAVIYYGTESEFARGAEAVELGGDSMMAGRLFGYPDCCLQFFADNDGQAEDRTPRSISDVGPFESILNPIIAELYGVRLHFHFACSPRCRPTLQIARDRLNFLKEYAPSISMFEALGEGITVYGPTIGAALITEYIQKDTATYEIGKVIASSDRSARVFGERRKGCCISIRSAHFFEIDGEVFDGDNHFAALFPRRYVEEVREADSCLG
jgi:hypothetical protein